MKAVPSAARQSGFTLLEVLWLGAAMLTGLNAIDDTLSRSAS
ncbi:MAG: hypothetical protein ACRCWL_04595 [Aeromonas sp.]